MTVQRTASTLTGWQRLWVVLTALWTVCILGLAWTLWPSPVVLLAPTPAADPLEALMRQAVVSFVTLTVAA